MTVTDSLQVIPGPGESELRVILLDVGHGNCAVLQDGRSLAIVDVPRTQVVRQCLALQPNPNVRRLILSHADQDHIGGALTLLAHGEIPIRELWLNPNSCQRSKTYLDLLTVASDRHRSGELNVHTNLNVGAQESLSFERVGIEVLYPDILSAGIGPVGSVHPHGPITGNGMSAVLRVSLDGMPTVLLPGDMDGRALDRVLRSGLDISAPVLVFPHHGGSPKASNDQKFVAELCDAAQPELVVFSIGRRRFTNPSEKIVRQIRQNLPEVHIACTQLSRHCHSIESPEPFDHIRIDLPAAGHQINSCCAESILIEKSTHGLTYYPGREKYNQFIHNLESPLCRTPAAIR
ncbi:MAG: competence protein ComEC [Actinomycetota bacterium]|nr:competence protein ComEC [Actinomycetota bacterium]